MYFRSFLLQAIALFFLISTSAFAGDLDSPAAPTDAASAMYTLEDLYNRLNSGAAGSKRVGAFAEPGAGPTAGTGHSLDDIMGLAPAIDDANGATSSHVISGKTFWGLTSAGWGLQTGTAFSAPPQKSGQTTSYAAGDNGDLEKGVAWPDPRFTDNGDGTVTDNLTGLIWLKNANCFGSPQWATALTNCNNLADGSCGLTDGSSAGDWRLPSVNELHSLVDRSQSSPCLPSGHPFTGVQNAYYWSSTTWVGNTSVGWCVLFNSGSVNGETKTLSHVVWPVKGGQ